jgi:hypothetical protein
MVAFETCQTVPVVSLSDMAQPAAAPPVHHSFPLYGDAFTFVRVDLSCAEIEHPNQTYFVQITDHSLAADGLHKGDILIVDREPKVESQSFVLAWDAGRFFLCRILFCEGQIYTYTAETAPKLIGPSFGLWGVIKAKIR